MLAKLADALLLLALTVLIHAAGLTIVMRRLPLSKKMDDARFAPRTWLLIRLASWVITIHIVEIAMWAFFFWWKKCLPDFESSLYFSVVTYTTVGYGDLVLAQGWRLFAGVESAHWHPDVRLVHGLLLHRRKQVVRCALPNNAELK